MRVLALFAILLISNSVFCDDFRITQGKDLEARPEFRAWDDTCSSDNFVCTIHQEVDWEAGGLKTDLIVNHWKATDAKGSRGYFCKFASPELTYKNLQELLQFDDEDVIEIDSSSMSRWEERANEDWASCNVLYECGLCSIKGFFGLQDDREYLEKVDADAYIETEWLIVYIDYLETDGSNKGVDVTLKAVVVDKKDQAAANLTADNYNSLIDGIMGYLRHN
ncbi:MAG: hypothetical protein ABJ308_15705 [Halieaceae bacterium]